jgi:hypothetical protein
MTFVLLACLRLRAQPQDHVSAGPPERPGPASTEAIKTMKLQTYEHKLQPGDIILVNISSLTQEQYNVFNKQSIGGGNGFMMMNNVAGLPLLFPVTPFARTVPLN